MANNTATKQPKFLGVRTGWEFKTGDSGLGYYRSQAGPRPISMYQALYPQARTQCIQQNLAALIEVLTTQPRPDAPDTAPRNGGRCRGRRGKKGRSKGAGQHAENSQNSKVHDNEADATSRPPDEQQHQQQQQQQEQKQEH